MILNGISFSSCTQKEMYIPAIVGSTCTQSVVEEYTKASRFFFFRIFVKIKHLECVKLWNICMHSDLY